MRDFLNQYRSYSPAKGHDNKSTTNYQHHHCYSRGLSIANRACERSDKRSGASRKGGAENAGLENAGVAKMQGWKTREWKTRYQTAGVENAGMENAGV